MKKLIILLFLLFPLIAFPLDVVTYYFNAYDSGGEEWGSFPQRMVDGLTHMSATATTNPDIQLLTGNTCPGTDLGTISKVEIRVYAHTFMYPSDKIELRPVFTGGDGDDHDVGDLTLEWSNYIDITSDTNAPSPWTWSAVQNLDCDIEATKVGNVTCSKVEIQVTYSGVGTTVEPAALPLTMTLQTPTISDFALVSAPVLGLTASLRTPTILITNATRLHDCTLYGATIY